MTVAEKIARAKADYDAVYEAGKKAGGGDAEYKRFWSALQDNGNRTSYLYGFYQWRVDAIDPQYDVRPINATNMFQSVTAYNGKSLSIPELEARNGIKFDFSKTTAFGNWLGWGAIEDLGFVDTTSCPNPNFSSCNILKKLSIALKEDGSQNCSGAFDYDSGLEDLTIVSGVFGSNLNFSWSPLSKDSILSVFNALSTTTTGLTVTFKQTAVEAAFTTDEWNALIATKTNWTYALA